MSSGKGEDGYFDGSLEQKVQDLLEKYHVPGLSVAVVQGDKIWARGFGIAQFPDTSVTPDTIFHIGSTTKAMLAAGMGLLMEDSTGSRSSNNESKSLSWRTTIKSILPDDFVLQDSYAMNNLTIEDCLSHRSGLSGSDLFYGTWMGSKPEGIVQKLRYLGPLNKPMRTDFQYNNLMYSAVGAAMEKLTNLSCNEIMNQKLFKPLEMTSTYWNLGELVAKNNSDHVQKLARGYYWVNAADGNDSQLSSNGYYVPDAYLDFAGIAPAGGVVSTVTDFAKWIRALLRAASDDESKADSPSGTNPIIGKKLFGNLTTPRSYEAATWKDGRNTQLSPKLYSLGWVHPPAFAGLKHPIIGHAGGLTGFGAQAFLLPNDNFGCVTFGNTELVSNIVGELVCYELIGRRLDLNEDEKTALTHAAASDLPDAEKQEPVHSKDGDVSSELDSYRQLLSEQEGVFTNPAYGEINVRKCPTDKTVPQVVKSPFVSMSDRRYRDKLRSHGQSLLVTPVAHHTWGWMILLHPQKVVTSASESGNPVNSSNSSTTFMDTEFLNKHGHMEDDRHSIPRNKDTTLGPNCRSEPVLAGSYFKWGRNGAAFRQNQENGKVTLGMRLALAYTMEEGTQSPGYEEEMVWFEKIS